MSKCDFLLEIGLEEIPARFVDAALAQLTEKLEQWFKQQNISYSTVTSYATPRRLAVLVEGVAVKQEDIQEEAKGPAKKIALDEAGNWTKAAEGFARSQGVSTEDLFFKEIKGVEYAYVIKDIKGIETRELLPQVKDIITGMTFPKNMRWGSYEQKFVRPIRWLVALFGSEVIPFEITEIHTNNQSEGHRFLGKRITITEPSTYQKQLLGEYVIVSPNERRESILAQIKLLEEEHNWQIPIDQELLEEVTHLVEYPTALYGTFDADFLAIPQEVLITSMKEHQRYFPVRNQQGDLLPHFVTFRNGDVDHSGVIARGNEKVLRARLSDARFFYEEDKKLKIDDALKRLENVVFHEELGTIGDKIRRVKDITIALAQHLQLNEDVVQKASRTAEICKFDLVSQMVYEFPELQGRMGEEYAALAGEDAIVSKAIFEHYLPRFAGDELPTTTVGSLVSVADKLDSIIGCFGIGIVPTGSQDPYALRRQATGIVQIMLHENWELLLSELFEIGLNSLGKANVLKRSTEEIRKDLQSFFTLRVKNRMQEQAIRYDVIDAVTAADEMQLSNQFEKANVLMDALEHDSFKAIVETFNRVNNLAAKNESAQSLIDVELFAVEAEKKLYAVYLEAREQVSLHTEKKDWLQVFRTITSLKEPIDQYFDQVMIMVEDEQIRANRLAQLEQLSRLINSFADFSKIVFA